jgi:hypothetical protein
MRYCAAVVLLVLAAGSASATQDPAELLERINAGVLEPDRAVALSSVEIGLGPATLNVEQAVLIPAAAVAGRSAEFVLVGDAHFRISAPNSLEASQLRLFTGREALDVEVHRAVLALASDSSVHGLMVRQPTEPVEDADLGRAEDLYREWLESPGRRGYHVDWSLLKDALGDAAFADFSAIWCETAELGRFHLVIDPNEIEQVTIGQFVPYAQSDIEAYRQEKSIRRMQWYGWYVDWRPEDVGYWDVWMSQSLREVDGVVLPGNEGFEPEHYDITAEITDPGLGFSGRAAIDLRAVQSGRRAVDLRLFPDLRVWRVTDGSGDELFFDQSLGLVTVALPRSTEIGELLRLNVDYGGPLLLEHDPGVFTLRASTFWYPHAGTRDRATYDVTIWRPKKYGLFATGRLTDSGEDNRAAWERRELRSASKRFTFEIGKYKTYEASTGGVDILVAIPETDPPIRKEYGRRLVEATRQAVKYMQLRFGDYPTDTLTVVRTERRFSQGSPGFVTLARQWSWGFVPEPVAYTLARELAYTWWGNLVGLESYRDQWLREALADYLAELFVDSHYRGREWPLFQNDIHESLLQLANNGRPIGSLGPVVLGRRLDSSLSDDAVHDIIHGKSGSVVRMLAEEIGPARFLRHVDEMTQQWVGRVVDTELFVRELELRSDRDLASFAEQFIYGTDIPRLFCTYDILPDENKWIVRGKLDLHVPSPKTFTLQPTDNGGWDVVVDRQEPADLSGWKFELPVFVGHGQPEPVGGPKTWRSRASTAVDGLRGTVTVRGRESNFVIPSDKRPTLVRFNPENRALCVVFDETTRPTYALSQRARALSVAGRLAEADEMFAKALAADDRDRRARSKSPSEPQEALVRALAYLDQAHLLLDLDRDDEASVAMARGRKTFLPVDRYEIDPSVWLVDARIQLRAGRFGKAYSQLRKALHLEFLQRADESLADAVRRVAFRPGVVGDGRAYAMLAVAAHHTGREAVCQRATQEAIRRQADMAALIAAH